jgi:hypothetical protein
MDVMPMIGIAIELEAVPDLIFIRGKGHLAGKTIQILWEGLVAGHTKKPGCDKAETTD